MKKILCLLPFLVATAAAASDFSAPSGAPAEFAQAGIVSNEELDNIRGGALQLGNITIDYSFFELLQRQIGGDTETLRMVSYSTSGAPEPGTPVQTAQLLQTFSSATTVQNTQQDVTTLTRVIDIVVTGLNQINFAKPDAATLASRIRDN